MEYLNSACKEQKEEAKGQHKATLRRLEEELSKDLLWRKITKVYKKRGGTRHWSVRMFFNVLVHCRGRNGSYP